MFTNLERGDDKHDIPSGILFAELPTNWRCPVCSAKKTAFANIGPAGTASGFKENLGYGLGVNNLTPTQKNILIFGVLPWLLVFHQVSTAYNDSLYLGNRELLCN